ncbi:hypothetical protein DQ04_00271300 [Trypanosoma grayi]|uniref:hypothetical protein n=1 Tax=Trypanosoma grayi TaxID=71804 RepID=UPI0004F3FD7C|nr:hypothetical protein DQ04_00271300 [Trypanosoma grayi]KEG14896.1 hypothetical protein DQ04_00271300 [Trypanosoma grayi]
MDLRYGARHTGSGTMGALGFCPIVDELQAFNLTGMGSVLSSVQMGGNASLIVYGQGKASNPTTEYSNETLYAEVSDKCKVGELAVVNFLLFRLSMTLGQYTYASNTSYPESAGFEPTCDKHDRCPYVSDSVCIGHSGSRNCARCYSAESLKSAQTIVWASYYGTDRGGKVFRSGESNPAQFQKFSIGALDAMARFIGE